MNTNGTYLKWNNASKSLPDKDCRVLICKTFDEGKTYFYDVVYFSNDLYKVDKYDFADYKHKKDRRGFYSFDSEYGNYEETVEGWAYIPEYKGDNINENN